MLPSARSVSNQWVWGEVLQWGCAGSLGNKDILVNSLIPWKRAAKTYVWYSASVWAGSGRQRDHCGGLWFRSIKSQVVWREWVGADCSLSLPMQEVATVKQSCRSHFQNKRRYFFIQQILDLWNSLPKGVIIAEVFAGIQGKTGQVPGREVHHWANYIRLKESLELKVVGGWKKTCRKDHHMLVLLLLFWRARFVVTAADRLLCYMDPKNLK